MKAQISRDKLNDDAKTSWDIWDLELARAELRQKWLRYSYVFGYGGPHPDLPNFLLTYHKVDTPADMDALIAADRQAGSGAGSVDGAGEAGCGRWHPDAEVWL